MFESVGKFHYGYWNVLEMSAVSVGIHTLLNSVSPVVWSFDIHHISRNFASVFVRVHGHRRGHRFGGKEGMTSDRDSDMYKDYDMSMDADMVHVMKDKKLC
jgi:hypothetical protein